MATRDEIRTSLETSAQRPLEMEQDGRRARAHSLRDQLAYLRYRDSIENASGDTNSDGYINLGIRTSRIEPGGAA